MADEDARRSFLAAVRDGKEHIVEEYLLTAEHGDRWQSDLDQSLVTAIQYKHPANMQLLVKAGANLAGVFAPDHPQRILFLVFESGIQEMLDTFLTHFKGDLRNELTSSPVGQPKNVLHAAVQSRQLEFVKTAWSLLQEHGLAEDFPNNRILPRATNMACTSTSAATLGNPFSGLVIKDHPPQTVNNAPCAELRILEFLLEQEGIDVNATENNGKTALHLAARYRNMDVLKMLVKHGADLMAEDDQDYFYPWMEACHFKHYTSMAYLLDGIDLQEKPQGLGEYFLLKACEKNWVPAVSYLLEKGVDANCKADRSNHYYTPLMTAVRYKNMEVIRVLLEDKRCDVNQQSGSKTALMCSLNRTHYHMVQPFTIDTMIAQVLIQGGADPNTRDKKGYTMLLDSTIYGSDFAREFLLENGGDLNVVAPDGLTLLWKAVHCGKQEGQLRVQRLLELNIDIRVSQYQYKRRTPLQLAFGEGYDAVCNLLLDADCSIKHIEPSLKRYDYQSTPCMQDVVGRIMKMCSAPYSLKSQTRHTILRAISQGRLAEKLTELHSKSLLPSLLVNYLGKAIKFTVNS